MIIGHVFGIPIEETAVQLVPVGAATVAVIAIAGRAKLGRLQLRFRRALSRAAPKVQRFTMYGLRFRD